METSSNSASLTPSMLTESSLDNKLWGKVRRESGKGECLASRMVHLPHPTENHEENLKQKHPAIHSALDWDNKPWT